MCVFESIVCESVVERARLVQLLNDVIFKHIMKAIDEYKLDVVDNRIKSMLLKSICSKDFLYL